MKKRDVEKGLDMLKKLRELDKGSLEHYETKEINELKKYFGSKEYESEEFLNELSIRIEEGLIEPEIQGDRYKKEKKVLIHYLRLGQIYLTDHGKTYVEIYCYFKPYVENKTNELNKKIKKIEDLQNNLFLQISAIIGIFIAIFAFILQGINFITNKDFFNLCFWQQIITGVALYIPLGLIILFVIVLSRLILWIFPMRNKEDKLIK